MMVGGVLRGQRLEVVGGAHDRRPASDSRTSASRPTVTVARVTVGLRYLRVHVDEVDGVRLQLLGRVALGAEFRSMRRDT